MRSLRTVLLLFVCAFPLAAQADRNPDFDADAKPILRQQRGLIDYISRRYEVRDAGLARNSGGDNRRPYPPFIFFARPRGYSGDYYITLMVQPGPPGHILKVIDPTRAPTTAAASGPYRPTYPSSQNGSPPRPPQTSSEPIPVPDGAPMPTPVPPTVGIPDATSVAPSLTPPTDVPPSASTAPPAASAPSPGSAPQANPDQSMAAPPVPTSPPPPDGAPPDYTSSTPSGTISPNGQITPFPSPPTNTPSLAPPTPAP